MRDRVGAALAIWAQDPASHPAAAQLSDVGTDSPQLLNAHLLLCSKLHIIQSLSFSVIIFHFSQQSIKVGCRIASKA